MRVGVSVREAAKVAAGANSRVRFMSRGRAGFGCVLRVGSGRAARLLRIDIGPALSFSFTYTHYIFAYVSLSFYTLIALSVHLPTFPGPVPAWHL